MVATGDDVDPVAKQLLRQAGSQPRSGSEVLAVGDDQVQVELAAHGWQHVDDGLAPRLADDVADDHAPQQRGAIGHRA
jgi:hypothetical protein